MVVRLSFASLAGALVPAVSIYLTGGTNRSLFSFGLILGLMLVLIPLLAFSHRAAQLLWTISQTFRSFHAHYKVSEGELRRRHTDRKIEKGDDPVAGDVISALVNMGEREKRAREIVMEIRKNMQGLGFEELLKMSLAELRAMRRAA